MTKTTILGLYSCGNLQNEFGTYELTPHDCGKKLVLVVMCQGRYELQYRTRT